MHWSCPLKHKGSKHYRVASNSIFETSHSSRTEHLMFFMISAHSPRTVFVCLFWQVYILVLADLKLRGLDCLSLHSFISASDALLSRSFTEPEGADTSCSELEAVRSGSES